MDHGATLNQLILNDTNLSIREETSTDQLLANVIQSLFEDGQQPAFNETLEDFITLKDSEIEKISKTHYEGFVTSVDQLLKVRQDVLELKMRILELNKNLQESGRDVLEKENQLIRYVKILDNISLATDVTKKCIQVLELAELVHSQISDRKYYSALKSIERVQIANEPLLAANYDFAIMFQIGIPYLQNQIKDSVIQGLQDWFVRIRSDSKTVGRLAMGLADRHNDHQDHLNPSNFSNVDLDSSVDDSNFNVLSNDDVNIDFTPVYQCLHIHEVLGLKEEFEAYYTENRKLQSDLVLTPSFTLFTDEDVLSFQNYLWEIVGFFVIEDTIKATTGNDYFQGGFIEELWDTSTARFKSVFSLQLMNCQEPELLMLIKQHLLIFTYTLEGYGYKTLKLMELLSVLCARYLQILQDITTKDFQKTIEYDKFDEMVVINYDEYCEVNQWFKIEKFALLKDSFPMSLPYSKLVPECCKLVKHFIQQYYAFLEGFPQDYGEFDEMLKMGVDSLLMDGLNGCLTSILENPQNHNLSQTVQILINIGYFEDAVPQFEKMIAETRHTHRGIPMNLKSKVRFHETVNRAKDLSCLLINQKIDDFFNINDNDGMPNKLSTEPNPYLKDLTLYLLTVFGSAFLHVPGDIRNIFYISACEHLANSLFDLFLKPKIKKFNSIFVENFYQDLLYIEKFMEGLPIPNLSSTLQTIFQLLQLLRTDHPEEYLHAPTRNSKYFLLLPSQLTIILEKFRDSTTFSLKKNDKKKSIDHILKTIRSEPKV